MFHRIVSLMFLFLIGCSSGSDSTNDIATFPIDDFTPIFGSLGQSSRTNLQGSGAVRFTAVLGSVYSSVSFTINAQLSEGGSLALVSHAAQSTLGDGVKITLTRSGLNVSAIIQVNSSTASQVLSARLNIFDPTNLKLVIDVHNLLTGPRVIIWDESASPYTLALANVDSSVDVTPAMSTQAASGNYWGLMLTNATVSKAQQRAAKISL